MWCLIWHCSIFRLYWVSQQNYFPSFLFFLEMYYLSKTLIANRFPLLTPLLTPLYYLNCCCFVNCVLYLEWNRWITINYGRIAKSLLCIFDVDGDGKFTKNDITIIFQRVFRVLTVGLPSASAFLYGISLGFKLNMF